MYPRAAGRRNGRTDVTRSGPRQCRDALHSDIRRAKTESSTGETLDDTRQEGPGGFWGGQGSGRARPPTRPQGRVTHAPGSARGIHDIRAVSTGRSEQPPPLRRRRPAQAVREGAPTRTYAQKTNSEDPLKQHGPRRHRTPTDVDSYSSPARRATRRLSCMTSSIDIRLHAAIQLYSVGASTSAEHRNYQKQRRRARRHPARGRRYIAQT